MIPVFVLAVFFRGAYTGLDTHPAAPYLLALSVLLICLLLKYSESRLKFLVPGMLAVSSAGILILLGRERSRELISLNMWVLRTVLLAAVCYFAVRVAVCIAVSYKWFRRVLTLSWAAGVIVMLCTGFRMDKWLAAAAMLPMLAGITQEIQFDWKKSGYTEHKGHLVSVSPFLILMCMIVFLFPSSDRPFDWSFAVRILDRGAAYTRKLGNMLHGMDEDYGAVIGFSESAGLLGSLEDSSRKMMEVTTGLNPDRAIYLTGKTFDSFTGREWTSEYDTVNHDRSADTAETFLAVLAYDPENYGDYLKKTDLGIKYLDLTTRYIFTPLKTVPGNDNFDNKACEQYGADILAHDPLSYDSGYRVSYYRMNRDSVPFGNMLRSIEAPDRARWDELSREHKSITGGVTYEDYSEYRKRVYRYYLSETVISDRLKDYLNDEMAGLEGTDKLTKLETILSSFDYTTETEELPRSVKSPSEYLDYLFFDSREGYCSHFATAFVLLARNMGFPARYVQGFCITDPESGNITVTSGMAHAWPEVYIDGLGWIPFEPTPGKKRASSWSVRSDREVETAEYPEAEPLETGTDTAVSAEEGEHGDHVSFVPLRFIVIPASLCLLFIVIFLISDALMSKRWYEKMDETMRFRTLCRRNLRIMRFMGYELQNGETLEEFQRRAGKEMPEEALSFIENMELTEYGDRAVDTGMRKDAENGEKALLGKLKEVKGKWYILYRLRIKRA